jgi:rubrerythrin
MKTRIIRAVLIAVIAGASFIIGSAWAGKQALSKTTSENLSTAMHGEAFAYAKYMLYAEHARQNGNEQLAKSFEETAKTERFEHFAEEARMAGLVRSDAENVKDAMQGESYEVESMYREFAQKAEAAGDKSAAELFNEIRADEMKHRDTFKSELARVEKPSPPVQ